MGATMPFAVQQHSPGNGEGPEIALCSRKVASRISDVELLLSQTLAFSPGVGNPLWFKAGLTVSTN